MFVKFKNEMQKNKKLKWAVISIPLLIFIALNSLYSEFKDNSTSSQVTKKNNSEKLNSNKVAGRKNTSNKKANTKKNSAKGQKTKIVSSSAKYAKMGLVDLKKAKERLLKEQQKLEKNNKKFVDETEAFFWLYSKHGDPIIALPTMIEKVAKKLDLKISSLSSIRRSKGPNGYDTVEVSISCMKDMDTIIRFLNQLENNDPKIHWSRSSIRPHRSRKSSVSFSGTANVFLLTDSEIGSLLQGDKWKMPPADVKSVGGRSPRPPSGHRNGNNSGNSRNKNVNNSSRNSKVRGANKGQRMNKSRNSKKNKRYRR